MPAVAEPVKVCVTKWYWHGWFPWGRCIGYHYERFIKFAGAIRRISRHHHHERLGISHGGRVKHYYAYLQYTEHAKCFFKTYREALEATLNDMLEESTRHE